MNTANLCAVKLSVWSIENPLCYESDKLISKGPVSRKIDITLWC